MKSLRDFRDSCQLSATQFLLSGEFQKVIKGGCSSLQEQILTIEWRILPVLNTEKVTLVAHLSKTLLIVRLIAILREIVKLASVLNTN